jgi:predicted DNA-binding protein (MmcQ/YjbR family)
MPKAKRLTSAETALRKFALTYPESSEHFPWDHVAVKVKGKVFLFLSNGLTLDDIVFSMTVKLPQSGKWALTQPFAAPAGYGMGKSGWVTAQFRAKDDIPVDLLEQWIDESYRAIAPKKVLAKLDLRNEDGPENDARAPAVRKTMHGAKRRRR